MEIDLTMMPLLWLLFCKRQEIELGSRWQRDCTYCPVLIGWNGGSGSMTLLELSPMAVPGEVKRVPPSFDITKSLVRVNAVSDLCKRPPERPPCQRG
jgi:hypothetical protein